MQRWLLLLGSNEADATVLEQALTRLAALGALDCRCRHYLPPRSGEGAWYHNALAILALPAATAVAALRLQLRDIEAALGRDRSRPQQVRIDIDILALDDGTVWRADAHALEKGDLDRYPAPDLLQAAGITLGEPGNDG